MKWTRNLAAVTLSMFWRAQSSCRPADLPLTRGKRAGTLLVTAQSDQTSNDTADLLPDFPAPCVSACDPFNASVRVSRLATCAGAINAC